MDQFKDENQKCMQQERRIYFEEFLRLVKQNSGIDYELYFVDENDRDKEDL
jgi:hypothetical protein